MTSRGDARTTLTRAAESFVTTELEQGRVPSDINISNTMCIVDSHCLDNENLELVKELSETLCTTYVAEGKAYKYGDEASFTANVLSKGLQSTDYYRAKKQMDAYSKRIEQGLALYGHI